MATDIVTQLYKQFYHQHTGAVDTGQASSHWKQFSKNFQIKINADESIQTIKGYGFGGSDDNRFLARVTSVIGNAVLLSRLNYPGLSKEIRKAKKTVLSMGLSFSQDAFRQACTKYLLEKETGRQNIPVKNILIIGDGHGILAALMSEQYPDAKIFLIDLGATLFFQAYYLGKKFTSKQHTLLGYSNNNNACPGFFYCPAEQLENFPFKEIDLAINVASMQEMSLDIVANYFKILRERKTKLFYCCNRLEKWLPDGQVTRFLEYPWKKEDKHLIDEKCPWHQFFVGRSGAENLKLFNLVPVPFFHRYDGLHWHRLTLLSH